MAKNSTIPREISWLSFNARVLQEANDPTVPLKVRIHFLAIYSNNLDEFFRVRVAVLKKIKSNSTVLEQIHRIVLQQQLDFNRIWKKIIQELKKEKVFLLHGKQLNAKQKVFAKNFFDEEVSSSIIPLLIQNMTKLPAVADENIFLGIMMQRSHEQKFALIEIPTKSNSRFVSLPSDPGVQNFMLLEDLIRFNLPRIFLGYTDFEASMFKVTKDAEIDIDKDISTTFIQKIERGLKNRRKAQTIRLQYDKTMNPELLEFLIRKLNISDKDSVIPAGHIRNFRDFLDFPVRLPDSSRPHPSKHPALAKSLRVSDVLQEQDILLHFPYHSFNSIIDLLREAAMDPDVTSIKITGYRFAPNSKICNALINAARNAKKVHVVLELRASFNEEANFVWKTKLEEEGVKVFLSNPQMKVHAKICVIKKQLGNRIEQYGFIGTGNLNEKTALTYTDLFLFTSDRAIMADLNRIFRALENPEANWKQLTLCNTLLVAPVNMRESLSNLIDYEINAVKAGKAAHIILNLNALTDEALITKLYDAARAGVLVQAIIRGAFCAEIDHTQIHAISIVDEYLEHGRILLFHHSGQEKIYISSADWMVRNLDYRIEVAVPIKDKALKNELKHILKIKLSDTVKARWLDPDLSNRYVSSKGKKRVRSQLALYDYLQRKDHS